MPTELDAVMVGMVLGQKDCGLAASAVISMLMQLIESVYKHRTAEQRAACIALGDVSGLTWVRIGHACARAATFSMCCEQGCVSVSKAVDVVDLLLQLHKLMLMLMSRRLGILYSIEDADTGGQTHACARSVGCEQRGVLSLEPCYMALQLAVCLLVGMHLMLCLSELCACG